MIDLSRNIAVVTGASRGGGRAIACALGDAGATVYVTGRSTRSSGSTENLPGTIEETAEEVTARGGVGIPVRCDHTIDADVENLFARVRDEQGRLDLLVNNAWGGYEHYEEAKFDGPFWEQPMWRWKGMFDVGVRGAFVASRNAMPLMLPARRGLIVSTIAWAFDEYLMNVMYDTAKNAIIRMMYGMAHDLRPYNIAAVALAPGFMRTERVMAVHAKSPFDLGATESPAYLGRAVVALAADENLMEKTGKVLTVGDLAREYNFTDLDGRQPEPFRL